MRGLSAVSTEKLAHSSENHYLLFYWLKGTLFVPETNNKHTLHWKKQPQIPNHLSCQTKITKVTTDPSVVLTTWVTLFMVREACSLHAPPPHHLEQQRPCIPHSADLRSEPQVTHAEPVFCLKNFPHYLVQLR